MKGPSIESWNIEARTPVLDYFEAEQFPFDKLDKEWTLLTEALRQDILKDPETRRIARKFIAVPVSETLPDEFLQAFSSDERIIKLKDRFEKSLGAYLSLPAVPESELVPDIKKAQEYMYPSDTLRQLESLYGKDTEAYYLSLDNHIKLGMFGRGVTAEERLLVARRFRFARDVKMLALIAETLEEKGNERTGEKGEVVLPGGTTFFFNDTGKINKEQLLNPSIWEKRRQIKDRVFELEIGGKKFILKERKTKRHLDTKSLRSLTSLEEFSVAKKLNETGVVEEDNVVVCWEKPVASVNFPDDFQFTVFEFEEGFGDYENTRDVYVQTISEQKELYEQEFSAVKQLSEKFKNDPRVFSFEERMSENGLKKFLKWFKKNKDEVPELTFEDFARIKTFCSFDRAGELREQRMTMNGFVDRDKSDYSYKILQQPYQKPKLEILGFDFEYIDVLSEKTKFALLEGYKLEREREKRIGLTFLRWGDGSPVTRRQKAGYFAMVALDSRIKNDTGEL